MKIEVSLKDLIVYLLIVALIISVLMLWFKLDSLNLKNQVMTNTQGIQSIVNYINQQQANQQPQISLAKPPEKKGNK